MKTDKFLEISTTDKLSKMLMLVFTGVILGTVIARTFYDLVTPVIDITLGVIALFCVLFAFYMFFTGIKKSSTKIAIFKDYISFISLKKNCLPTRTDVGYSDIKSIKISPQATKRDMEKGETDVNKFSLRIFGYKTVVESLNGDVYEICDSKTDGVLMYSPTYIYRMLDIKKHVPNLNLELVNFNSKNDSEDFETQFKYYEENGTTLSLLKNKKYVVSLLQYTALFLVLSLAISTVVSSILYYGLHSPATAYAVMGNTIRTFAAVVVPMWALAYTVSFYGARRNDDARVAIDKIFE